jgi:uncharacterized repeat protein (TIGR02543 family)
MRRISILSTSLFTSFAIVLSGLISSSAHATDSVVTVSCETGSYKVTTTGSVVTVSEGETCSGAVVIPQGVTAIGEYAFGGAAGLTSISLPETLNQVGDSPFYGTSNLTQINVAPNNPDFASVDGVLFGRNGISATLIAYPANKASSMYTTPRTVSFTGGIAAEVTTIRSYAFQFAQKLATLTVSEDVTTLGGGFGASLLSVINLPETLNQVGDSPFYGTSNLTQINVAPNNPDFASVDGVLFGRNGISATLIAYPANKASSMYTTPRTVSFTDRPNAAVTSIDTYAFQNAQKLATLNISEGVTTLGGGIAESTRLLSVINLPATYTEMTGQPFGDAYGLTSITIKASVVSVASRTFINARSLSNIYFLGDEPDVDNDAFFAIAPGAKAYVKSDADGFDLDVITGKWKGLTVVDLATDGDYVCSTGSKTTAETPSSTPRYKITGGVVSDGISCAGTVLLPDGIKAIGNSAFEAATLTSINIPAGVISIGDYAFFSTTDLTSFTVAADNPNYSVNDGVLLNKAGTTLLLYPVGKTATSYLIPSGVTSIGDWAFYQENSLNSITIPEGVVTIGNHSFRNLSALTSITLPATLGSIGEYAFSFATALTSIIIPANVATIGSNAFEYAVALSNIYFLGDAPTVGPDAFANIVTLPKAYKKTENTTFTLINGKWNGLTATSFDYLATYESNGGSAVSASAFTTGGTLTSQPMPTRSGYGFAGWSATDGGTAVAFPYAPGPDVTNDITLFANWLGDGNFFCSGDLAGERATDETTNIYAITDGVVTAVPDASCTGDVVIPAGANSIGAEAFKRSAMNSVSLPATLTSIGDDSFSLSTALVELSIPEGVVSIGEWAFSNSELLEIITLPASVNNIGNTAFQDSLSLENINVNTANANFASVNGVLFNKSLTTLEAYPAGKPADSYTVPATVEIIADRSFISARALKSVLFPADSQLTSLEGSVFQTSGLTSIILPAGVETIGNAFNTAQNLTSVTLPGSVTSIGAYAFQGSTRLSSFYFLGGPPTVEPETFTNIGPAPKAFVTASSRAAFGGLGSNWNGLTVAMNYTLTYNYNSATGGNSTTSGSYTTGDTPITLPTPTRTGYTFAGWYSDAGFTTRIGHAGEDYSPTGVDESLNAYAKWTEVPVLPEMPPSGNPPSGNPPADNTPSVDLVAQAAAADLAARTIKVKSKFAGKALASRVGVKMVSPKAKVTFKISKASKKICTKSGSKIKTLKAGNCVVTFTVQEPKPKKGKKPKATKTVKTFVVN